VAAGDSNVGIRPNKQNTELRKLARRAKNGDVYTMTLQALGLNKGRKALNLLIRETKNPDNNIRRVAISGIGSIGIDNPTTIKVLQLALGDDSISVRLEAINALIQICSDTSLQFIEGLLSSPDKDLRFDVSRALSKVRSEKILTLFMKRVSVEDDPDVLYMITLGLGQQKNIVVEPVLQILLEHKLEHVRNGADKGLKLLRMQSN
jgi:HEAT repeat protein